MKKAIVYYSMSGNTEYVAKYVSEKTGADLIKIEPTKEYPKSGFKKFFWGGKSAVMGETPDLEKYEFNSDDYDYIIFGTPVWASTFAPPIKTFIKENKDKLKNKKFAIFTCFMGSGADKTIEKLSKYLEAEHIEVELKLIDPKDKKTDEKDREIEEFCKKINEGI